MEVDAGGSCMAKVVPIGARGEAEETVAFEHTLTAHHASLPTVYSTPDMIRLMETAGVSCAAALLRGRRDHGGYFDPHRT